MYFALFSKIADAIEMLQEVERQTEEMYILYETDVKYIGKGQKEAEIEDTE
jgi:hypothetical protein